MKFALLFVCLWASACTLLYFCGWFSLSRSFPKRPNFKGKRLGWTSGKVSMVGYKNSIIVDYSTEGIRLKTLLMINLGIFNQPVVIPWDHISIFNGKNFWGKPKYFVSVNYPVDVNLNLDVSQTSELKEFLEQEKIQIKGMFS